jgi:hypothetical protein
MTMVPYPEAQARDYVRQVVQAAIDVPPAGGAASRLIDLLATPKLVRRRDNYWFRQLGEAFADHLRRVGDIVTEVQRMQDDDKLITTILVATEVAGRTHQQEKLEALRNACLNVASNTDVDEQYVLVFVRLIDDLTLLHLKVLTYLADPPGFYAMHGLQEQQYMAGSRRRALADALPEVVADAQTLDLVLTELGSSGLTKGALGGMVSGPAVYDVMASDLGLEFLGFIDPPWPASPSDVC